MRHNVIILILSAVSVACLKGQDVKVTSAFDTTRIYIGDQTGYTITVEKPAGLDLKLPSFRDSLISRIEIVAGPSSDSVRNGERLKITSRYTVTSFDSGRYQLPPVFAELKEGNNIRRFYSDYALLEVQRVKIAPADTTMKIFDIVKPYRAPLTAGEILPWVLLALLLAAMAWMSVRYFKRHWRRKPGDEPEESPEPAHVTAYRELEELRTEQLWQRGLTKEYYVRLTEIARKYLEKRYRIFSLELTTSETLAELAKKVAPAEKAYGQLREVLTGADLVKFAKHSPSPEENENSFAGIRSFVDLTREADIPAGVETEISGSNEKEVAK